MENLTAKKITTSDIKSKIISAYISFILENGHAPASIFKFSKDLKMKEEDFYIYFSTFESIKSAVWTQIYEKVKKTIESEEIYKSYSSREKFLVFLFTWIEELKKNRSYFLSLYGNQISAKTILPKELKEFKSNFKDFANGILKEGKDTEEIANRPYLSDRYDEAMWIQVWFVFQFWLKDTSTAFEKTDAAIEKSVNLAFDLMGKSAVDTFVDFAKFLYQNK